MEDAKIQFPCNYPIKVIGVTSPELLVSVTEILLRYDPTLTTDKTRERQSRKGNYTSITFQFYASGKQQLEAMFAELKNCNRVRVVL